MTLASVIEIVAPEAKPEAGTGPLDGKSFCFTGCRPTKEESDKIIALGGIEKSGVSKGLTHLVFKTVDLSSAKAVKARGLGVTLVSYEHFQELIK